MNLTNPDSANSFYNVPEKENLNANLCSNNDSYFYPKIPSPFCLKRTQAWLNYPKVI